ncbi:MAG TPA: hypothetical protein DEB05_12395 [Firmicutes bacterium]|jgi:hypothetical protein|nr:hypothetical protein [Bacillota bacterium]HBT17740.1 hypothetical protein [Bacillota bacterium]
MFKVKSTSPNSLNYLVFKTLISYNILEKDLYLIYTSSKGIFLYPFYPGGPLYLSFLRFILLKGPNTIYSV